MRVLCSRNIRILLFSFLLFSICMAEGLFIARDKPLWRDEIYTQLASVEDISYANIILFKIKEGNICPLYYLIQKCICAGLHYRLPEEVDTEYWTFKDPNAQVILRINPVLFTSVAITLIFVFFALEYSFLWGIYSIIVSMSSFMVWAYWAEARPYGLLMFLTTIQSLIFLRLLKQDEAGMAGIAVLFTVNILLSFCSVFSIIHIVAAAIILWFRFPRAWKGFLMISIIPAVICVIYYAHSPRYQFWFDDTPAQLISANIPKDRLFLLFIFGIYLVIEYVYRKRGFLSHMPRATAGCREGNRYIFWALQQNGVGQAVCFLLFSGLMLLGYMLVLLKFKLGESSLHEGFQVSNRYFIGLTPVGIIAFILSSIYLTKASKNRVIKAFIIMGLAVLLAFRIYRSFYLVKSALF